MADDKKNPLAAFAQLKSRYRWFLIGALDVAIKSTPDQPDNLPALRARLVLETLSKALTSHGQSRMEFEFEEAMPFTRSSLAWSFSEALPRLTDDMGNKVMPGDLFPALRTADSQDNVGPSAGSLLRLWMIAAQIKEFYAKYPASRRLSINIDPLDADLPEFREGMTDIMRHAHACGYRNIVLEALETSPWDKARLGYLRSLQEYGATLAIDDYGAPGGCHTPQTLVDFSNDPLNRLLIVKIDGAVVRDYIDKNDLALIDRLREIRTICPNAKVVAEWVSSADDARKLLSGLKGHGLEGSIHLAQGRDLVESADIFLQRLASDLPSGPAP